MHCRKPGGHSVNSQTAETIDVAGMLLETFQSLNVKYIFIFLFFSSLCSACDAQALADSVLVNNKFKWTIIIPAGFTSVDPGTWAKMQNRGSAEIEETLNQKIENNSTDIFVFKSNNFNYFESSYQPFDTLKDGNFIEISHELSNIIYKTFAAQIKNAEMDTSFTTETIDGLDFFKFKLILKISDNFLMNVIMYNRIFGKEEFAVNIMYIDEIKGAQMLSAWKKSKFRR